MTAAPNDSFLFHISMGGCQFGTGGFQLEPEGSGLGEFPTRGME